ncbi:TPA: hypothetical protein ACS1FU_002854 [Klebsiella aerogenes]
MNSKAHEVQIRWLESRQPDERNGNEAEIHHLDFRRASRNS